MEVLTLQQAGMLAWSKSKKNKSLFATTSIYDSFNASESAQEDATLQLYSFDVVNRTSSSQKIGQATFQGAQFTSIDWETFGENENFPAGIIASGFDNGVVGLWDANYIIQNSLADSTVESNQKGLISLQEVHESPVHTIAFNPFRTHLIASGGVEVAVHNLEKNISEPDVFSPGSDVHQGSPITSVSWNRKVPHILGSASQNGTSVVWDLKLNKAIFNFSDPSRVANNRNVCLSWNPEIPTQVAVVYDDAKVPELQIWDLRSPKGPIFCTVKGHTKGIHYLDWSVTDPSSIITLGRDNKVCTWNYKLASDNLVSEFSLNEPCTQVKWSPRQPDIYSVTAATGSSTIYSLNNQLNHIPAWMRTPVGARFSFDGRLAVFSEKGGVSVKEYKVKAADERLEPYIEEFEKNFTTTKVDVQSLSQNKLNSILLEEKDRQEWQFIQAAAKNDPDEIIEALGFDKAKIIKKAENYTGKYYVTKTGEETKKKTIEIGFKVQTAEEAENFFSNLGQRGTSEAVERPVGSVVDVSEEYTIQETIVKNTNWNAGIEKIIKNNILMGNIEGAVDSALKCGRVAEALLLAYAQGGEIFKTTIKSYVTSSNDPFVKNVIRYLVEDQRDELVLNYSLDDWKECVALCVSLSQKDGSNFKKYMDQIATRFIEERKDYDTALLCYILSKDFQRILETYASYSEKLQKGSLEYTIFLMNTIEKIIALKTITQFYEPNSLVDKFLYDLSKVLQNYNKDLLILNLLTINDSFGFECLVIKDRLLNSSEEFQGLFTSRNFPFRKENVNAKVKKAKVEPAAPSRVGAEQTQKHVPNAGPNTGLNATSRRIQPQTGGPTPRLPFTPNTGISQQTPPVESTIPPVGPNVGLKSVRPAEPNRVFDPTKKSETIPPPIKQNVNAPPPVRNPHAFHNEARDHQEPVNDFPPARNDMPSFPKQGPFVGPNVTRPSVENIPGPNVPGPNVPGPNIPGPNITQNPNQPKVVRPGPMPQPAGPKNPSFPKAVVGPVRTSVTGLPPSGPIGGQGSTGFVDNHTGGNVGGPIGGPVNAPIGGHIGGPTGGPMGVPRGNVPQPSFPPAGPTGGIGGIQRVPPGFSTPSGQDGFPKTSSGPVHGGIPGPNKGAFAGPPVHGGSTFPPKAGGFPNVSAPVKEEPKEAGQIPSQFDPVIETVTRGLEQLEVIDQRNPKKKQEMDQKMQSLFDILAAGTMKPVTVNDLTRLCQALDEENLGQALTLQQKIAREDYTANKDWLYVMRRMVQRK